MRLIDATYLLIALEQMSTIIVPNADGTQAVNLQTIQSVVLDAPTVYDIDKVVEQLEERMSDAIFEKATQECNESHLTGLINGYGDAIEIVKAQFTDADKMGGGAE